MRSFFRLVSNENMKLRHKVSTYVMIGILVVATILVGVIGKVSGSISSHKETDWKTELTTQNDNLKKSMDMPGVPKVTKDQNNKTIKINEYRIEHDIKPVSDDSVWGFVGGSTGLMGLVTLFVIIVAAGIVSSEFSQGTMKLLLIRPWSRSEILLSKYISVFLYAIVLELVLFVSSFLVGGVCYGFKGIGTMHLAYSNGAVKEVSMIGHIFTQYGYASVSLLMMVTFAFMISTVFRNSSLSVGLSIFLMFTGNTIVALLSKYDWVKYILFANTDLAMYADGVPLVDGMTMTFSIVVLLVYFAVFNIISWVGFDKREVSI